MKERDHIFKLACSFLLLFVLQIVHAQPTAQAKFVKEDHINPGKSVAPLGDSASLFNAAGIERRNAHEYQEAIWFFTEAIKHDSALVSAYINRAYAKRQLFDYKSAL